MLYITLTEFKSLSDDEKQQWSKLAKPDESTFRTDYKRAQEYLCWCREHCSDLWTGSFTEGFRFRSTTDYAKFILFWS